MAQEMSEMRIGLVDLDGTLADYVGALRRDLESIANPMEVPIPDNPYELIDKYPHIKARARLIKSQYGWWRSLEPMSRGFEIVEILKEFGFELHIATKGPADNSQAWKEKVDWCRKHIPDAGIHIVEKKSLLYGKVLVDDYPGYAKEWLEWRPRGLVIMPLNGTNAFVRHPNIFLYRGVVDRDYLRRRLREILEDESA